MRSFSARSGFPQSLEKKFLSVVCVQLSVDFAAVGILSGQKRMERGGVYMKAESEKQEWTPMISVVIAAYNEERRLDKCFRSILEQTYQDFEIVVVNDGSTDGTAGIINRYMDEYKEKVVCVNKKNGGLASARNCGIDVSRGKYITFLDADDYIDRDYLMTLVSTAKEYKCDVVCSGQYKITEDGKILHSIVYKSDNGKCLSRRLNISGKIYLTSYIKDNHILFPEGKTYEDNSFNLQAFFLTNRIYFLDYAGYYQVVHEGSITSKMIQTENLPLAEWSNCIEKYLDQKEKEADSSLFEFTVLSFFTYLLFVRIRKREYLGNEDRKSNVKNAITIAQVFQEIANTYFPNARKNKYETVLRYNELPLLQKLGVRVFSIMCYLGKLEDFTRIFYKLAR